MVASPAPRVTSSTPQNAMKKTVVTRVPPKPPEKPMPKETARTLSPSPVPFSEDALACQFSARHGDTFRYVSTWGRWMQWTGQVWRKESTLLAYDLARALCRDNIELQGVTEVIKKTLSHGSTVAAIVKMASADRRHAARHDQWDTDKMKLNTPNGVIDLTTGDVLPHDPEQYHTKISGTVLSNNKPELWLQFLNRIFDDKSILPYLQRWCGYCLTGNTNEHALAFCYGGGKNGKTTFTKTLFGVLGDYSHQSSFETFAEHQNTQHPTSVAALNGPRFALVPEVPKNRYWNEALVNQCTGGDHISAHFMRCDDFTFLPEFKLVVCGNHKPRLRSVNEAARRRLHLIPFEVTIPEAERDPHLYEKLTAEWPEILGWMVDGCLEWQQKGLAAPELVSAATCEYLDGQDKLGLWLTECCILGGSETASSSALYADWTQWCAGIGEHEGSQRAFSQELEAREGIRHGKGRDRRGFIGLSLRSVRPAEYQQEEQ